MRAALPGESWVDLYEIEVGDILLEEIATGIEEATDFVLLWSAHSANSRWVRFEFNMAFVRYIEDNAIGIRIVRLDDTPVPLQFRPFLQARGTLTPAQASARLAGDPPRRPIFRAFLNRNTELNAIESALYSSTIGHSWLWGMTGIGKRSIAKAAADRFLTSKTQSRSIEVRAGTGPVELDLMLSATLGVELPPDSLTEAEAGRRVNDAVGRYAASGGVWVFTEVHHWLDEAGHPNAVLEEVLAALDAVANNEQGRLALFTTTRKPSLAGAYARGAETTRVSFNSTSPQL